ncbi:MAG TPA: hypothetical protein VM577_14135 [Anaerovoracaceae bacterium]|nr:hypothetical protein [Anaerovoracaceae bacterium]
MKIKSEIFDEYAKIAVEQGLISEAEEKTNPRYDTKTLSDIEILYGVKPNGEDDDILDKAHPNPMIIAPAYDRVNGLVENLKEQHNVMCGIARKPNDGKLTQHRYVNANNDLANEVIKLAFMLDKNDQEDLMSLADSCADRLTKEAIAPLIIAGIVAGVAALAEGLAYLSNNPESQNIKADATKTLKELDEATSDSWFGSGFAQLRPTLQPVIDNVSKLVKLADDFNADRALLTKSLLNVSSAVSKEQREKAVAQNAAEIFRSGKDKEIANTFNEFKSTCDAVVAAIPTAIKALEDAPSQYEGDQSEVSRWLKHTVKETVLNSDTQDAVKMLGVMYKSCSNVSAVIAKGINDLESLRQLTNHAGSEQPIAATESPAPEAKSEEKKPKQKGDLPSWV